MGFIVSSETLHRLVLNFCGKPRTKCFNTSCSLFTLLKHIVYLNLKIRFTLYPAQQIMQIEYSVKIRCSRLYADFFEALRVEWRRPTTSFCFGARAKK